ncbi:MAG: Oxygen-independent coproporphyrinogen-III oxidase 1 [Bacteroidetes bacterium ADurb.Bin145]|jgi:oxygen-independent coproporphyrinogen-3 oxidase|nr:MAG: Oxygen-independent coproporphyrinogen-III oxidase 1 [Bacteroidetes bacterium ADurb.Bin145]
MAGIYIHIPYCKKLCSYCDFYHIISDNDHSLFLDALKKEIEIRQDYLNRETVSTIYFGGGTPSVLSIKEIEFILDILRKNFIIESENEITIEVNPDDIRDNYFRELKNLGINRISLGVQSWRDEDLRFLNRRHTSEQSADALASAFAAGFENVSIDLIYGIPGMTTEHLASNLIRTFSYDIKHLSAYHLTIEPDTVFGKMKQKNRLNETDEEESVAEFNLLIEKTEEAGFVHYEISNFSKPGYISLHNTNYWRQVSYLGLGPSAHSFNGYSRQWNVRNLKKYANSLKGNKTFFEKEELDLKTKFNEYILTSLRTMWGIDLQYVEKAFEKEGYDYVINLAGKFINYGLMEQKENALTLTNQGKMISDNIISEFIMPVQKD